MIPWLNTDQPFPSVQQALREPNGLLAAGADLSLPRLISAYRQGIFPWYSEGQPVLWWSPDPRMVLEPAEIIVSRSLRKRLRKRDFEVRVDTCFLQVMRACAQPRPGQPGTWITDDMLDAYGRLHAAGYAHSAETWMDGTLSGGLYGVALGGVFFGESMFTLATDASKIALAHLASLGAREIPRKEFMRRLAELVNYPARIGRWRFDDDLFD